MINKSIFLSTFTICFLVGLLSDISAESIEGCIRVNYIPTAGVMVEVIDDGDLIARVGTKDVEGSDTVNYSIPDLPAGKKLLVRATYMLFPDEPVSQTVILKPEENKRVNIIINVTAPDAKSDPIHNPEKYSPPRSSDLPVLTLETPVQLQTNWDSIATGTVTGTLPEGAKVVVYIKTTKVGEQGSVSVKDGEGWKVKTSPTVGETNIVFARLLDADGVMYAQSKYIKIW